MEALTKEMTLHSAEDLGHPGSITLKMDSTVMECPILFEVGGPKKAKIVFAIGNDEIEDFVKALRSFEI